MSIALNQTIIGGNCGQDPQVRFLANEKAVASWSVAVNRTWKDADGQKKEKTTWVSCEAWGRTAELVGQFLTKGRQCIVVGHLEEDSWEDKQSGQKRTKLKLVADSVQFIGARGSDNQAAPAGDSQPKGEAPARANRPATAPTIPDDGEPPF